MLYIKSEFLSGSSMSLKGNKIVINGLLYKQRQISSIIYLNNDCKQSYQSLKTRCKEV